VTDTPLNHVEVSGTPVPWEKAFPRPEWDKPEHWEAARPLEIPQTGE
jgi:hypothetical protein